MVTDYHADSLHQLYTDEYNADLKNQEMKWRDPAGGVQRNAVSIPVFSETDAVQRKTAYKYP